LLGYSRGQINVNEIVVQDRAFPRAYNREYETLQTVSLDKFIPATKTTYLDALAAR
jgi:hypothetical protein